MKLFHSCIGHHAQNFNAAYPTDTIPEQESIPVGCVPPTYRPYTFRCPPDVSTRGSSSEQLWTGYQWQLPDVTNRGPEVNKFEQVSSDGPQMSLEGRGFHVIWRGSHVEIEIGQGWGTCTWDGMGTPCGHTDTHQWKHYLTATLFTGGNKKYGIYSGEIFYV